MEQSDRGGEVRTGLFVVSALALLIFGVLWMVGSGFGGNQRQELEVWLDDAGGVRAGDPVRLSGIEVGRIEAVGLRVDDQYPIVVTVAIDGGITLRQGASARLTSDGLLGAKFLAIDPGPVAGTELSQGPILGQAGASLEEALATVAGLGDDAGTLLRDTRAVVQQLGPRLDAVLSRGEHLLAAENVDEITATVRLLRQTLQDVGPQLPILLQRLDGIASDLEEGMNRVPQLAAQVNGVAGDLRHALGPDGERLAATLEAARVTLETAQGTFASADQALASVNVEGDELQAAIRDLRRTAANLQALSETLKQRPDRLLRPRRKADHEPGSGASGSNR